MNIIVLIGQARVGKTYALELLKKANDGTVEYFQDDIRVSDLLELTLRDEKLGVVTTNDWRVKNKINTESLFTISNDLDGQKKFLVSNRSGKLDWTEAFRWLKSNSSEKEKPTIVDEFFNFICK